MGPVRQALVQSMLHNPIYAGAYAYGRCEHRMGLVDGQKRLCSRKLPQQQWKVCLRDRHPGYISWDEFMANQEKLHQNRTDLEAHQRGAAREGSALLQGLVLCGRCGRRMRVGYCGNSRRAVYHCQRAVGAGQCYTVPAKAVDEAVVEQFLATVKPPQIELGLAVVREAERQASDVDRQWKLRLERAQYEAWLAERRYKAIDPENRVVARTLEREWNEKLETIEQLEREREEVRRREKIELTETDRARILELARNLSVVWNASTTTNAERKNLLRMLVCEVAVSVFDVPRPMTRVQILWQTGAISDFTIERKDKYSARATAPQAIALIEESFKTKTDEWIAAELNGRGLRTGADLPWTLERVRRVRHQHEWFRYARTTERATAQDEGGLYSAHAIALRLGVKPNTVLSWARHGLITAVERGSRGHSYRFQLDEQTLSRLAAEKQKMQARRLGHRVPRRQPRRASRRGRVHPAVRTASLRGLCEPAQSLETLGARRGPIAQTVRRFGATGWRCAQGELDPSKCLWTAVAWEGSRGRCMCWPTSSRRRGRRGLRWRRSRSSDCRHRADEADRRARPGPCGGVSGRQPIPALRKQGRKPKQGGGGERRGWHQPGAEPAPTGRRAPAEPLALAQGDVARFWRTHARDWGTMPSCGPRSTGATIRWCLRTGGS